MVHSHPPSACSQLEQRQHRLPPSPVPRPRTRPETTCLAAKVRGSAPLPPDRNKVASLPSISGMWLLPTTRACFSHATLTLVAPNDRDQTDLGRNLTLVAAHLAEFVPTSSMPSTTPHFGRYRRAPQPADPRAPEARRHRGPRLSAAIQWHCRPRVGEYQLRWHRGGSRWEEAVQAVQLGAGGSLEPGSHSVLVGSGRPSRV